jgi:hypothetical protein
VNSAASLRYKTKAVSSKQSPKIQHLRTNGGRSNKKPITIFGRQITSLNLQRLEGLFRFGELNRNGV